MQDAQTIDCIVRTPSRPARPARAGSGTWAGGLILHSVVRLPVDCLLSMSPTLGPGSGLRAPGQHVWLRLLPLLFFDAGGRPCARYSNFRAASAERSSGSARAT